MFKMERLTIFRIDQWGSFFGSSWTGWQWMCSWPGMVMVNYYELNFVQENSDQFSVIMVDNFVLWFMFILSIREIPKNPDTIPVYFPLKILFSFALLPNVRSSFCNYLTLSLDYKYNLTEHLGFKMSWKVSQKKNISWWWQNW